MSFQNADTGCTFRCWAIGAGVGLIGMLLLWMGPAHFLGALCWGIILAVVTGLVLSYLLCRDDAVEVGDAPREDSGAAAFRDAGPAAAVMGAGADAPRDDHVAASREDSADQSFAEDPEAARVSQDTASIRAALQEVADHKHAAAGEDSGAHSFGKDVKPAPEGAAREDSGAASFDAPTAPSAPQADTAPSDHPREDSGAASFARAAAPDETETGDAPAREDSGSTSFAEAPAPDGEGAAATPARKDSAATVFAAEDYDRDGVIEGENEGARPAALAAARDGGADDLKKIKGVGPKLEALLNDLGFYHFDQIAGWTGDEVAWVDANLKGFRGRVSRDGWVDQARLLAAGGETAFSQKVDKGGVY